MAATYQAGQILQKDKQIYDKRICIVQIQVKFGKENWNDAINSNVICNIFAAFNSIANHYTSKDIFS
jgi:hypothetical protein